MSPPTTFSENDSVSSLIGREAMKFGERQCALYSSSEGGEEIRLGEGVVFSREHRRECTGRRL
jgi:hypothetical protein